MVQMMSSSTDAFRSESPQRAFIKGGGGGKSVLSLVQPCDLSNRKGSSRAGSSKRAFVNFDSSVLAKAKTL